MLVAKQLTVAIDFHCMEINTMEVNGDQKLQQKERNKCTKCMFLLSLVDFKEK